MHYQDRNASINLHPFSFFATVKRWYNKFNRDYHSLPDESPGGHLKLVAAPKIFDTVQKLIIQDHHVTCCEYGATLGINFTCTYKILHNYLANEKSLFSLDRT